MTDTQRDAVSVLDARLAELRHGAALAFKHLRNNERLIGPGPAASLHATLAVITNAVASAECDDCGKVATEFTPDGQYCEDHFTDTFPCDHCGDYVPSSELRDVETRDAMLAERERQD